MENTYKWVSFMPEVAPDPDGEGELKDVVVGVQGQMEGTDGSIVARWEGKVFLPDPDPDNFIQHGELTIEWMEQICEAEHGVQFRRAIDRQIALHRKAPRPKPLPCQQPAPKPSE
jgi:hypothetical protein